MSTMTNASGTPGKTVEKVYDQEIERVHDVANVKSDIDFTSIFANLIRKMDEGAQASVG